MNLDTLCTRLDEQLRIGDYDAIDGSPNGLQVDRRTDTVERVALAVDAASATITEARAWEADLLVVHHGLWWEGTERLTGRTFDHVAGLIEDDIGLYVAHLPLDGHQELGNAAGLAELLELSDREPFGQEGDEYLGQRGQLPEATTVDTLQTQLEAGLAHDGSGVQAFPFGPDPIEDLAIVTGSGVDYLEAAAAGGADALLTGEGKHRGYHAARELGITLLLGGHYATEVFGVQAIAERLSDWGLETHMIHHPTRL